MWESVYFNNYFSIYYHADINECVLSRVCVNGECENLAGDFTCNCKPGYELDEYGGNCTGNVPVESSYHLLYFELNSDLMPFSPIF